ncbi:hypothetical protein [Kitasatospora sp. MAP5-34]|uniref:hypothetical protein n=1 Tax=Kitasatospora sp. MAP5-34 TaxID=3035102 RepID=UPI002477167C|nr:hypothetical protein [Kitasatospora sp. MAP5-34]MDH6574857.1 hypothetical protein [Kitasatospora sp. MAP5-34]
MSQSFPSTPEQPGKSEQSARSRVALGRLVPRRRGARWAALAVVVVIVGGGAAAAAVLDHHHSREGWGGHYAEAGSYGQGGHRQGAEGHLRHGADGAQGGQAGDGTDGEEGQALAPAPLPALPAAQAAAKAAGAVPGGRVETLRITGQQGGGSAWLAVVLGTDGVRHDVSLAGADGTVTGNTVPAG